MLYLLKYLFYANTRMLGSMCVHYVYAVPTEVREGIVFWRTGAPDGWELPIWVLGTKQMFSRRVASYSDH